MSSLSSSPASARELRSCPSLHPASIVNLPLLPTARSPRMHSFSEQCLDMARSILGHNLDSIQPDGTVLPAQGEEARPDEPGHVAFALGEYYRATGELTLKGYDIIDLAARCVTAQMFTEPAGRERPGVRGPGAPLLRALQGAQPRLGAPGRGDADQDRQAAPPPQRLRQPLAGVQHRQGRRALQLRPFQEGRDLAAHRAHGRAHQPDELGRILRRLRRGPRRQLQPLRGDGARLHPLSALQLHANSGVRDRKLPTLRTYAEKYIRMMPDLVRQDGLGWAFGRAAGRLRPDALRQPHPPGPARRVDPRRAAPEVLRYPAPALHVLLPDVPRPGARLPRPARRGAHGLQGAHDAHGQFRRRALPLPVVAPDEDGPDARRRPVGRAPEDLGALRHLRQVQPQGAGPLHVQRRRVGPAPVDPADQLRQEPLERRAALPPLARASSTGRTTSTCRSCSPSSRSAST